MKGISLLPLKDREYLLNFVANDKTLDFTYETAESEFFREGHFVFGYEVFNNNIRCGVAFALVYDDLYTLDGYNESSYFFMAVLAGKAVVDKLFLKYTDVAFTEHEIDNKMATLLAKRVGFKQFTQYDTRNVMVIEKEK